MRQLRAPLAALLLLGAGPALALDSERPAEPLVSGRPALALHPETLPALAPHFSVLTRRVPKAIAPVVERLNDRVTPAPPAHVRALEDALSEYSPEALAAMPPHSLHRVAQDLADLLAAGKPRVESDAPAAPAVSRSEAEDAVRAVFSSRRKAAAPSPKVSAPPAPRTVEAPRLFPAATLVLIGVNLVFFLANMTGFDAALWVMNPSAFSQALASGAYLELVRLALTPLSGIFLHANPAHLIGNMIGLAGFGCGLEPLLPRRRYLAAYFGSGLAASVLFVVSNWGGPHFGLGASGAIFGLMGAYIPLYTLRDKSRDGDGRFYLSGLVGAAFVAIAFVGPLLAFLLAFGAFLAAGQQRKGFPIPRGFLLVASALMFFRNLAQSAAPVVFHGGLVDTSSHTYGFLAGLGIGAYLVWRSRRAAR